MVDPEEFVRNAISDLPRIDNSIDVQVAMKDLYETKFRIFNHVGASKTRPLASVAFHPAEDVITGSRLKETAELYVKSRIHDAFHISFHEFIRLPFDVIQEYCEMAPVLLAAGAKDKDVLAELQKQMDKNK